MAVMKTRKAEASGAYLRPAEAARELGVKTRTVLGAVASGRLPVLRLSERTLLIPRTALRQYQRGGAA